MAGHIVGASLVSGMKDMGLLVNNMGLLVNNKNQLPKQ